MIPSKMTLVPVVNLVRSRVVLAGTIMLLRMIVEYDALDLIAVAAVVKVHEARSSMFAAGVAATRDAEAAKRLRKADV